MAGMLFSGELVLFFVSLLLATVIQSQGKCHYTQSNGCSCNDKLGEPIVICEGNNIVHQDPLQDLPADMFEFKIYRYPLLSIPSHFFSSFPNLKNLKFETCNLSRLFAVPKNLQILDVPYNMFKYQHLLDWLSKAPKLNTLVINNNKIVVMETQRSIFRTNTELIDLGLKSNYIPVISENLFKYLHRLKKLDVSNCSVSIISPHAFDTLKQLSTLILGNNVLKSLPYKLLRFQTKLKILSITKNQIQAPPPIFALSMILFDFSYNQINDISYWDNSILRSVLSVILSGNNLQKFPKKILEKTSVWMSIDFSYNLLTTIEGRLLRKSPLLRIANFAHNHISTISKDMFEGLPFLTSLSLQYNMISSIPNGVFQGLNIHLLFLNNNRLAALDRPFQGISKHLRQIILNNNDISTLSTEIFEDLDPKARIYINCKSLRNIESPPGNEAVVVCSEHEYFALKDLDSSEARSLTMEGYECGDLGDPTKALRDIFNCKSCDPGYINKGRRSCIPCPRGGFYQDEAAQIHCKTCNPGQFVNHSAGTSQSECQTCPAGTNPKRYADTRACYCLPGFARRNRFGPCRQCVKREVRCFRDSEHLSPGFWWRWNNVTKLQQLNCFRQNVATSGTNYNPACNSFPHILPRIYACAVKAACLGGDQAECQKNYTGPVCSVCSPGYTRGMHGCYRCPNRAMLTLQGIAVCLVLVLYLLLLNVTDRIVVQEVPRRTLCDLLVSVCKILLAYYQLLAVIITLLSGLAWPPLLVQVATALHRYVLHLFLWPSLDCLLTPIHVNAYHKMLVSLLSVIVLPLLRLISLQLHSCLVAVLRKTEIPEERKRLSPLYWRSLLAVYFLLYPSICQRILQTLPFNCRTICLDRSGRNCTDYLGVDFSLKCHSSDDGNWKFVYFNYAALAVPASFPLLLFLLLWRSKREIQGRGLFQPAESVVASATRFCYENYHPSFWYWEIFELLRKLLFSVGFAFLGLETKTNLGYLITLSGICTIIYAYSKPIRYRFENYLQMIVLSGLFINLCMAVILCMHKKRREDKEETRQDYTATLLVLLMINIMPFIVLLMKAVHVVVRRLYLDRLV